MDSAMAILNNRFQIMAQYRKLVIVPLVRQSSAEPTRRCGTSCAVPSAC